MHKLRGIFIFVSIILFISSFAFAHIPFGEYAGTHTVAFVPKPRSPFVGENVEMAFYLRDLRGILASELFVAAVVVQKILGDEELGVFGTKGETITDGVYKTSYTFKESGNYRVDFTFWKPDEPGITRDAVFDIEVRDRPDGAFFLRYILISLGLFFAGLVAGLKGRPSTPANGFGLRSGNNC